MHGANFEVRAAARLDSAGARTLDPWSPAVRVETALIVLETVHARLLGEEGMYVAFNQEVCSGCCVFRK